VGSGEAQIPIELVDIRRLPLLPCDYLPADGGSPKAPSPPSPQRRASTTTPRSGKDPRSKVAARATARDDFAAGGAADSTPSSPHRLATTQASPPGQAALENVELSTELRQDLKVVLESLQSCCRTDFKSHPRSLKFFLHHLNELCKLLGASLLERSYRETYGSHLLHHFVRLLPNIKDHAELPPSSDRLPKTGWLPLTVLLALADVSWDFKYNSLVHRICHCRTSFPGLEVCAAAFFCDRPSTSSASSTGSGATAGHAATAASVGTALAAVAHLPPAAVPTAPGMLSQSALAGALVKAGTSAQRSALESKIRALYRRERHLPPRLVELASALRSRFLEFAAQIPSFLEDFMAIQEVLLPPPRGSTNKQLWDRFVVQVLAEVSVLDRSYALFEQMYLRIVDKLIGQAVEPVRSMTGPSGALVLSPMDPFREVQTAVICQRLGLLKRKVHFGGPHNLVHFDPAKRVQEMDTYDQICALAKLLLVKFRALCQVLNGLKIEQIRPELSDNLELRTAVLDLEAVWAECQFLLQQDTLDFITQLLDYLQKSGLSDDCRWQYRTALLCTEEALAVEVYEDDLKLCRTAMFETLPILVYLDEVIRDLENERQGGQPNELNRYREVFCPKDLRHHSLRRDFSKFDGQRVEKFKTFLMGDDPGMAAEESLSESASDRGQMRYFGMLYRQLKDVAAFVPADPSEVMQAATAPGDESDEPRARHEVKEAQCRRLVNEARARWLCVHRVAQSVEPSLFPEQRPTDKLKPTMKRVSNRASLFNRLRSSSVVDAMFPPSALTPKHTPRASMSDGAEFSASPRRGSCKTAPLTGPARTSLQLDTLPGLGSNGGRFLEVAAQKDEGQESVPTPGSHARAGRRASLG